MKAKYNTFVFIIILILIFFSCSFYFRGISINRIRIEDTRIENIFLKNIYVDSIRAFWSNNIINLHYETKDDKHSKNKMSYYSHDGKIYKSNTIMNNKAVGTIFYLKERSDITWKDWKNKKSSSDEDLVLIISTENIDNDFRDMVYVPGGYFNMGSNFERDEQPIHKLYISGFYMDKYEVTVSQYRKFCNATGRKMPVQPGWSGDKHPVVNVSWEEAKLFAKWQHKRLPTEAEWEYAARSCGKPYFYSWGKTKPFRKLGANIADESVRVEKRHWIIWNGYIDGYIYSAPVGSFYPNEVGLYDMTGNVCEWCTDWYDKDYYKKSPQYNPKGPEKGTHHICRGGSWNYDPKSVRTTKRMQFRPDVTLNYLGFRCARSK
jgi:sulfatase modifying factor 1